MENLLNIIFTPVCIFCNKEGHVFCKNCLSKCKVLFDGYCIICDKKSEDGYTHKQCLAKNIPTQVVSIFEYGDIVRSCIKKSKYNSKQFMSLKILTREALTISKNYELDFKDFIVCPIPISSEKNKERGFNQTEIIAKEICKGFNLKLDVSILNRHIDTKVQHGFNREERFKNIKDAFSCKEDEVRGKKILLIDDITTTGATFLEASKTLYESGALEVKCFSLSKKLKTY